MSKTREITETPGDLLERTIEAIANAKFTGKGDKPVVQRMLYAFEWDIAVALESAQADALSQAMSPRFLKARRAATQRWNTVKARVSGRIDTSAVALVSGRGSGRLSGRHPQVMPSGRRSAPSSVLTAMDVVRAFQSGQELDEHSGRLEMERRLSVADDTFVESIEPTPREG